MPARTIPVTITCCDCGADFETAATRLPVRCSRCAFSRNQRLREEWVRRRKVEETDPEPLGRAS
jgi:DNA-directed RNA polymerase subunit RPC12/RpoP